MAKESLLKLSNNNKHLYNIFNDNYYLEIGNIEIEAIEKLLNNDVISLNELSYFPIQKNGIGHSKIENKYLNEILPYLYFININLKNITKQLFVTYGLLKHNKERREEFIPIILIPVKLNYDNKEIFIHKISRPILNPTIIKYLTSNNIDIPSIDLDSIYDIDAFCVALNKHNNVTVELENYLTFGEISYRDYVINNSQFNISIDDDKYFNRMYLKGDSTLFLNMLNKRQRKAVYAAKLGKSFTIIGENETGKTLTLKNILLNALYDGKKVLYLSNMKETLDDISNYLSLKGLRNLFSNLNSSFDQLYSEDKNNDLDELELIDIDYKELIDKYDYIDEFEDKISGRILDHRFIEVLEEISYYNGKDFELLDIDDLSSIYKSEYERIITSLESISRTLNQIGIFKESKWKAVPIFNSTNNSSEIKNLIEIIHACFYTFNEIKKTLENDFDIISINDYAMMRKIINDIENTNISLIPKSWKTSDLEDYNKAIKEFKTLKDVIYSYKEINQSINQIINIDLVDIDDEYNKLLGSYYSKDDYDLIDNYFKNRSQIMTKISRITKNLDNYQKGLELISEISGYEFNNDLDINELIKLNNFLNNYSVNHVFNNVAKESKLDDYYLEVEKVIDEINRLNSSIKDFYLKYPKFIKHRTRVALKHIEEHINSDDKKIQRNLPNVLRRYLGRGDSLEQIDDVKRLILNTKILKTVKENYCELINKKYNPNDNYLNYLKEFKGLFDNVNDNIKEVLLKILSELEIEDNKCIKKTLNDIAIGSSDLVELENLYGNYNILFSSDFKAKIIDATNAVNYLKSLYSSNDRIKKALKNKDGSFVPSNLYASLKELSDKRNELELEFNGKKEYIDLFGYLYKGLSTDIIKLLELLTSYERFTKAFNGDNYLKYLVDSKYNQINIYIERFKLTGEKLNEVFKQYSHIFNDGVTRYYYNSLEDVLDYLSGLVSSGDELDLYLEVTKGLKVLNEYNLKKLIDYICSISDAKDLVDEFKYTYFKVLEEAYLKKYPNLLEYNKFNQTLEDINDIEKKLIRNNETKIISKLRKEALKYPNPKKRYTNYNDYIRQSDKLLYLASSDISNLFLDKNKFDLVIIDDAHLLPSSSYGDKILAKQVIIAGEKSPHTSVFDNLISETSHLAPINLDYRYTLIPRKLQNYLSINGITNLRIPEGKEIEVLKSNVIEAIYEMYLIDPNIKINVFIRKIEHQRSFIERFTKYFLNMGIEINEIVRLLTNNINISDLSLGYVLASEVNICNLGDYYNIDIDYICDNLINNILSSRTKVIIYDNLSLLTGNNNYKFINDIKNIISSKEIKRLNYNKEILEISNILNNKKDKTTIINNELIYRYNNDKYEANIIIWGSNTIGEALNNYRDIYNSHVNLGIDSRVITKLELALDYNQSINKLKRNNDV